MGLHRTLTSVDQSFNTMSTKPIFVNDMELKSNSDIESLIGNLCMHHTDDEVSSVPICGCKKTRSGIKEGTRCPECGTKVSVIYERDIESRFWIRRPKGVVKFMTPAAYLRFNSTFLKTSECNAAQYFMNPHYRPRNISNVHYTKLNQTGLPRGMKAFYENYEQIITALFDIGDPFVNRTKAMRSKLKGLFLKDKERSFCDSIPLPTAELFIQEKTGNSTKLDPGITNCLAAVLTSIHVNENDPKYKPSIGEKIASNVTAALGEFHNELQVNFIGGKPGVYRKNLFASRGTFTFRGVIVTINEPHHWKEIHLPWKIGVGVYAEHVRTHLERRGYTPREAERRIAAAYQKLDVEIADILDVVLKSFPSGIGAPIIFQRNPSLVRLSIQNFFVTKVKRDVLDISIGMSANMFKGPNADLTSFVVTLPLIKECSLYEDWKICTSVFRGTAQETYN